MKKFFENPELSVVTFVSESVTDNTPVVSGDWED